MKRRIETLTGSGTVTARDGQQVSVEYDLSVYQDDIPVTTLNIPHASIPGLKKVRGRVKPVSSVGLTLMLEMEDQRRLEFFFRDADGNIALRRWIE
jgi:hypothetical protein